MPVETAEFEIDGPVGRIVGLIDRRTHFGPLPVLFVHGNAMTGKAWLPLIESLDGERIAVAPDLRGHGRSVHSGPYGAEEYSDDLTAVMDHLLIERFHIVGGLFGGMVGCVLAARLPHRVVSLTTLGSALAVDIDPQGAEDGLREKGVRGFHEWQVPQAFPAGTDPALVQSVIDGASEGRDLETVIAATRAAFSSDVTAAAEAVQCPALVINGEHDPACTPALGEAMAKALRGTFVNLPGIGHAPMLETTGTLPPLIRPHLAASERSAAPHA